MARQQLYGWHSVLAALKQERDIVHLMLLKGTRSPKAQELQQLADIAGIRIEWVGRKTLDRLCQDNHQGVIAECADAKTWSEADLPGLLTSVENPMFLVLDGVQDPHNLGACLRTADAAGVVAVIAPKDRSVGLTATARKVACGAAETVPFISVTNLARTLTWLQSEGVWLTGLAGEADELLYDIDLSGSCAIVMGAEGDGLRRLTREHCDYLAKLPMYGSVSSLNVSVATGISLFEVVRQRASKRE